MRIEPVRNGRIVIAWHTRKCRINVSSWFSSAFWLAVLCLILFAALVVFPAVWSSKPSRRKAALDVLDRIIRWRL
jgi:hypothetical protein